MGFTHDGDADWVLAIDREGRLVDGDKIMAICGSMMKTGKLAHNTVVATVYSNLGLSSFYEAAWRPSDYDLPATGMSSKRC